MALQYVQAGFIAVVAENPGVGELDECPVGAPKNVNSGRDKLCAELIALGRNYVGLSVFQKLHILDWLCGQSWLDTSCIAVSGHSLGTEPAMMMAVLDDRIGALVFNDYLTHNRSLYASAGKQLKRWSHQASPLWHVIPGMLAEFDFPDLLAALAPTPLLITEGGPEALLRRVAGAYELASAGTNFEYHYYPMYSQAADRTSDGVWPPPVGMTDDEWMRFANVDAPSHCFHGDVAVPWLTRALRMPLPG